MVPRVTVNITMVILKVLPKSWGDEGKESDLLVSSGERRVTMITEEKGASVISQVSEARRIAVH